MTSRSEQNPQSWRAYTADLYSSVIILLVLIYLSKYTFCAKYALSYTASKFQAFAAVSVADLQAVSLTHT